MRLVFVLLTFLLFTLTGYAQNSKPILRIQSGGHLARIRNIVCTPDQKEIISVGDDKTIKIWDVQSGQLVHEINGEIA